MVMLGRKRRHDHDHDSGTVVEKGASLAKGPALVIGTILLAFGLAGMVENSTFPSGTFPDGDAQGSTFLGFEVNGYTNLLLAACGGLLLFGAVQHLLAKTMSVLTGVALAAATIIALIDGDDILGLAATNAATKLGMAIAAGALLLTALLPRLTHRRHVGRDAAAGRVEEPRRDREVIDRDAGDDPRADLPGGAPPAGRFRRDDSEHAADADEAGIGERRGEPSERGGRGQSSKSA